MPLLFASNCNRKGVGKQVIVNCPRSEAIAIEAPLPCLATLTHATPQWMGGQLNGPPVDGGVKKTFAQSFSSNGQVSLHQN